MVPVIDHLEMVAGAVASALTQLEAASGPGGWGGARIGVAEIDPEAADTATFCERYGVSPGESANCVVLSARRGGAASFAACVVLARARADVNGVVRRHLGARKVSFAPVEEAVAATGMEYGGITPIGLPVDWPVLLDTAVASHPMLVVGGGIRRSKLVLPGALLASLPNARVVADLAFPPA